jgi:hypothetical protein
MKDILGLLAFLVAVVALILGALAIIYCGRPDLPDSTTVPPIVYEIEADGDIVRVD